MKTPEQIAEGIAEKYQGKHWRTTGQNLMARIVEAIEADRAQLEAEYAYQVVTGGTSRYPLAIVGAYRSEFEAKAVAKEWNRVNNRHGIRYRMEVDA